MTLSVLLVTRDSALYLERLLRSLRGIADELVVGVDTRSVDATEEVCRRYADQLFLLEPFGDTSRVPRAWLIDQCRGDWILNVDDDELLSVGLVQALPRLMSDASISTYWIRIRWVADLARQSLCTRLTGPLRSVFPVLNQAGRLSATPTEPRLDRPISAGGERALPTGTHYLTGFIWWPCWTPRLLRNAPGLLYAPPTVHSYSIVPGDSRYVLDGTIYHLDHILHTLAMRLAKAQRYERLAPGNASWDQYVIPRGVTPQTEPIPADDLPDEGGAAERRERAISVRRVSLAAMQEASARSSVLDPPSSAACPILPPHPELFRADLVCLDAIPTLAAGQPRWLTLRLRNDSPVSWGRPGSPGPQVRVTCHWLSPTGDMYWFDAGRSQLPCAIHPGQTETVPLWVLAPNVPGSYRLTWELVMEQVGWFSQQGWCGPDLSVHVRRAPTPLSARQTHKFVQFFGVPRTAVDGPAGSPS